MRGMSLAGVRFARTEIVARPGGPRESARSATALSRCADARRALQRIVRVRFEALMSEAWRFSLHRKPGPGTWSGLPRGEALTAVESGPVESP